MIPTLTDDLFHYTSAEIGLDSVMMQMQLRLGLVESTNDPRESRPRYPSLRAAGDVPTEWAEDISHEADRLIRRAAKVACFTLDYELPESGLEPDALRGWAHPALWAHYGGRHTGVCLRFGRRALAERMREALGSRGQLFEGVVDYSFERSTESPLRPFDVEQLNEFGVDAVVVRYIEQHHRELFFRKHSDWSSEREYRWIFVDPGPLPVYVDITDCLTGVVLGDAFPKSRLDAVHHLAAVRGGLDVTQVKFHNGWHDLFPATAPPSRGASTHRRSGTRDDRVRALALAEAEAAEARARGERLAAPFLARIDTTVQQIAARTMTLTAVEVGVYPQIDAVPPSERHRAPGVPTYSIEYERGIMCVVEALPRYSLTFVASAAVQVIAGGQLKLHAALKLERWLPTGNEHEELWRFSREVEPTAAEQSIDELITAMLDRLEPSLATFNQQRGVGT